MPKPLSPSNTTAAATPVTTVAFPASAQPLAGMPPRPALAPSLPSPRSPRVRTSDALQGHGAPAPGWRPAALLLVTAMAWGLAAGARAQSLQVLHGVARGYDATFLAAQLQADASVHKAQQALALKRPSVTATAGSTLSRNESPWNSVTSSTTLQNTVGLSAQYTLYNRANDATLSQAELGVVLAQAQLQAADQELAMRVTQAYFDVLAASDALNTVQVSKKAIAEQVASAKKNFEVGTVTITDTREAEARLDLARAQELAAENDLNTARLALDQLVGRQHMQPRPLAKPVVLPTLAPANVEDWVRLADEHNPNLHQVRLGLRLSRLETDKARAASQPTVSLSAAVQLAQARIQGKNKASDGSTVPFGPNAGTGPNASVGVQVSLPLYSGGAIPHKVKETALLEQKSEADVEAARRSVAQATRIAFYSLRSQMARVAALEAAESSSALALEATQLGYQVGVRVNLDVLNAQTQLFQAQRDLARARYEVVVNLLKLRQTAGVLKTQDVAAVSALLEK